MATDLAEFTGAALGLHLVFGLSMWVSALLAAVATFAVLAMEVARVPAARGGDHRAGRRGGARVRPRAAASNRPPPGAVAAGALVPQLPGGAALLAVSIVGATVMPHVIYLHSSLTSRGRVAGDGDAGERRRIFRFEIIDVLAAMGVAGLINLAMLATAAAVFSRRGLTSAGGDLGAVVAGLNCYVGRARRHRVRRGAAGLRHRLLVRRHDVRAGRDGGLPAPPGPGVPAPRHHDDPGAGPDRRSASARPARWCSARCSCPSASRSR